MLFRVFTIMAVIALGVSTWILSSPAHRPRSAPGAREADLPGYYLKGAVLVDFDAAGSPTIRLEADRIDQIDHGTEVALTNVHLNYQTLNGRTWTLFGDQGRIEPGGKVIDVKGNVKLLGDGTQQAGTVIVYTETLSYDMPAAVATTNDDVRIEFGAHSLTAHGLTANLRERTLHLESKVNGRFQR